ncbi:efflux RND transporter periplasmic adaptor subunit [Halomonas lysinitropha]|uniref:Multidrug resistance protein MdtE n=1 Tax=Halomonas lysinitropha TaxID=2607506 RepID=A0A5K1IA50_9GAMM|nr:efflux RND transporter periplasmic adaptor subunit [Halomonas lysinitropha]VVZ96990.1 Multidrug resistance protein MdtE precursor [Halomonas lysinitropha]
MTRRLFALALVLSVLPQIAAAQDGEAPLLSENGFDCIVRPYDVSELTSSEQGVLTEILVGRGDAVAQGQVLARLDRELQQSAVELARIRAENGASTASAQARLKFRQIEFNRMTELRERNAASQAMLEEAEVELELARGELEMATAERQLAEAELAQAELLLSRRGVLAPFDAVVVEVTASPGEYAHEEAPVMTLAQLDPLRVEVYLPIIHAPEIALGREAEVTFAPPLDVRRKATVTAIDRVFDAASGTFGIRLDVPNADQSLPGEIRCKLRFEVENGG